MSGDELLPVCSFLHFNMICSLHYFPACLLLYQYSFEIITSCQKSFALPRTNLPFNSKISMLNPLQMFIYFKDCIIIYPLEKQNVRGGYKHILLYTIKYIFQNSICQCLLKCAFGQACGLPFSSPFIKVASDQKCLSDSSKQKRVVKFQVSFVKKAKPLQNAIVKCCSLSYLNCTNNCKY